MNNYRVALIAMFPSIEAYESFILDNDGGVINSVIKFAFDKGLILSETEKALKHFIMKNKTELIFETQNNITIYDLKKKISPYRDSASQINRLILSTKIKFTEINYSIFSRLIKEKSNNPTKRNAVRLISFWTCYEKPELLSIWNYDKLLMVFEGIEKPKKEGLRIAFSMDSSGDEITYEVLDWLKREIKKCLPDNSLKVISYNLTTFYVDFNKKLDLEFLHPSSYRKCTNDAISLAYQISIKWFLSKYSINRIFLSIGLAVGLFSNLNKYIDKLLKVKLPENPVIRMTEYTRQCVLINDIRIFFCKKPKEEYIHGGEAINIWWVTGFWNILYWDFIPEMLKEPTLKSNEILKKYLWFFDNDNDYKINETAEQSNSLLTFFQNPQQSVLGMEIAKILFYRKRFHEALEILRIIVCREPHNLVARTLRITIYWNLAIESQPYSISKIFFERADEEASIINENQIQKDEDFYSEYSFAKLAHAITIMKIIKKNSGKYEYKGVILNKNNVYKLLEQAESLYKKAIAISPTGNCSLYWLLCIPALKQILKKNEEYFTTEQNYQLNDNENIFIKTAEELFLTSGWLIKDYPKPIQLEFMKTRMLNAISTYDDSVSLRTYIPNLKYCYAVFVWDFSEYITYEMAITILQWLKEAINIAKQLEQYNLYIYTSIRFSGSVLPPSDFIADVQKVIDAIENKIGILKYLKTKSDDEKKKPIDNKIINGLKLCLLNI